MRNLRTLFLGMLVAPLVVAGLTYVFASDVTLPNTFAPNTTAVASQVNANFTAVKNAIDDNDSRLDVIENARIAAYQQVTTTARFEALNAGNVSITVFVGGTCDEVALNIGGFTQQVLVREDNGGPTTVISYTGTDVDTTIGAPELLRTIGNYNKLSDSNTALLVTWNAHAHARGPAGSHAQFIVHAGIFPSLLGANVTLFLDD